jgi:hypothetical protein
MHDRILYVKIDWQLPNRLGNSLRLPFQRRCRCVRISSLPAPLAGDLKIENAGRTIDITIIPGVLSLLRWNLETAQSFAQAHRDGLSVLLDQG